MPKLIDAERLLRQIASAKKYVQDDTSRWKRGALSALECVEIGIHTLPDAGCVRDDSTTQYCAKTVEAHETISRLTWFLEAHGICVECGNKTCECATTREGEEAPE